MMIQSMTGFSEKSFNSRTLRVKISIKSLNHRFFDWNCKGTPLGEVENRLRETCRGKIHRGKIEVIFDISFLDPSGWDLVVNEDLLEKIFSSLGKVSSRMNNEVKLSVDSLFRIPQIFELRKKNFTHEEAAFLERSFALTLEAVLKARSREGRDIARQVRRHVRLIQKAVRVVEKLAKKQPALLREKMVQRLKELNFDYPLSEERLAEEVAYLTQRYDLTEEIIRVKSHLSSIEEILSPEGEGPVGKMLDFLAQELYREANTLNSKSQDLQITKESLNIKGEVESIRQNVQNLE